eukprot:14739853-Alexandrium_andersonii.AAC.1
MVRRSRLFSISYQASPICVGLRGGPGRWPTRRHSAPTKRRLALRAAIAAAPDQRTRGSPKQAGLETRLAETN